MSPFGHVVAAVASAPQLTVQLAASLRHVTVQSPAHLTLHVEASPQPTKLPGPTLILQLATWSQPTNELAPPVSSQLLEPSQINMLPSPPLALHSESNAHWTFTAPLVLALHLVPTRHASVQVAAPQLALQSPTEQTQRPSASHVQSPPLQAPDA
jgi:hypothetical protein